MRDKRDDKAELSNFLNSLQNDITQIQQAEADGTKMGNIRESDNVFLTIFENVADGILIADIQNKTLYMGNKAICQMLGCSNEEIQKMNFEDIHPEDKLPGIIEHFNKQVRKELTLAKDTPVKRKDGSVFYADINAFPIKLGSREYLMGIFRDVTEHRYAEESLRLSEEKFRLAMEAANDALWDWNLVTNETYRNPRHATILGYEPGELSWSHEEWDKRIHPEDREYLFQILNEHLSGKRDLFECEYRLRTKSGDYVWILGRGKVVTRNDNGSPVRMIGTNIDITKRKKAEEEVKKFETIADKACYGVAISDIEGNLTYVNESFAQMHGYGINYLIGKNLSIFHSEEQMENVNRLNKKLRDEGGYVAEEVLHRKKDGTVFCALMNGTLIKDQKGQSQFLSCTAVDISEHKKAEQALKQNEERFRLVMEATNDALWDWDLVSNEVYRNPRHATMLGYEPEELSSSQEEWAKRIHPEDKPLVFEIIDKYLKGKNETDSFKLEYRLKTKSGVYIWVMGRGRVVALNDDGVPIRMIGTNINITERKMAEEALRESELRYRTLFETMPVGVGLATLNGWILDANNTMQQMLGYSMDELKQINLCDTYDNSEDRSKLLKLLQENGFIRDFETQLRSKDGTLYEASLNVTPMTLGNETVLLTVAKDITTSKRAREKLLESEETLRSLVNAITESVMLIDTKGTVLAVNEKCARRLGSSINELMGKCCYDFLHVDIREFRISKVEEVVRTGRPVKFEDRSPGRIVSSSLYPILDAAGNVVRVAIFGLDVTESRRMEQTLQESEEKYRTLVESTDEGIASIDENGVFLFINKASAKRLGNQPKDCIGKTVWDFFPKEIADQQVANLRKVIKTGQGFSYTSLTEIKGNPRWYDVNIEPLRDGGGNVIAALVVARDIHNIKVAEEQILKLSSAIKQSIDGIAISDLESRLVYVNAAYTRMHGYTAEEMIGMKLEGLYSDESKDECYKVIRQLKTQGVWVGELEHAQKDGTILPVYLSVTMLKDDNGEYIGNIGICRDMTEYKKTQEDLRIRDVAIAASINGIAIGDIEGRITYVNRSCLEMWDYEDEKEVLGRNIVEFWKEPDEVLAVIKTLQEKRSWVGELAAVRKDGSIMLIQIYATMVMDEHGEPIAMMASLVDITESRRSQQRLSEYREKMSRTEQLASLGTLSATVAHELTQPLTVIRLLLDNTLEKLQRTSSFSPDELEKKLVDSLNQISNIVSITNRFRNFSRRSTSHILKEINLKVIAGRIVGLLGESARRSNITLHIEDMDDLPTVYQEESDMEQLFFAIVNNAIQAADGEDIKLFIMSGVEKDKYVELRFSDNCGGIAPEHYDKIFEPFFTTKPPNVGTGLGLCIVKEIVYRAGGKIRVESKFGEGSTFIVTLPINEKKRDSIV